MLLTSASAVKRFGSPLDEARTTNVNEQTQWEMKNMISLSLGAHLLSACKALPKKIYINKVFAPVVVAWLEELYSNNLLNEITKFDGCFNVRLKRGLSTLSIHAFGCAIDFNRENNPLGLSREACIAKGLKPFSREFIEISRKHVDCGADWKSRPDGMHFQLKG